jgi:hypothetical protein
MKTSLNASSYNLIRLLLTLEVKTSVIDKIGLNMIKSVDYLFKILKPFVV